MQVGRQCGALALLFVVILCANIVLYLRFYRAATSPIAILSGHDFCLSLVLNTLNMSDVIAPEGDKKRRSPVVRLSIPPYPLAEVPAACRKLFEPLHADRASQTAQDFACYLRNNYNSQAKAVIRSNVLRLVRAFEHEKIELILDSGSLLGSWRHHGIIPYDDDIDFRIRRDDKPRIRKLFAALCARFDDCRFRDTEREIQHWKLDIGCNNSKQTDKRGATVPSCFMQIDFFFFWIEGDVIKVPEYPGSYPKSVFYPLIERPFEGVVVKTLRDYPRYYASTYSNNLTECRSYNHVGDSRCKHPKIDCNLLQPFHPFVRSFADHRRGILEFQVHQRKIVDVFYNPNN